MRKTFIALLFIPGLLVAQARTCDDFGFPHGCKVEGNTDGTYQCDETNVTVDYYHDGEIPDLRGKMLSWEGGPFAGVFVKGGRNYNEYLYNPPAYEGSALTAPQNKDISHTLFCYDEYNPPVDVMNGYGLALMVLILVVVTYTMIRGKMA